MKNIFLAVVVVIITVICLTVLNIMSETVERIGEVRQTNLGEMK